jgi:hypothetical protein
MNDCVALDAEESTSSVGSAATAAVLPQTGQVAGPSPGFRVGAQVWPSGQR